MLRLARQRQEDIPFLVLQQGNTAKDGVRAIEAGLRREAKVMGGFLGGMIVGAVVVVAVGIVLSLSAPLTNTPEVAVSAPEPAPLEVPEAANDAKDMGKDADLVELAPRAPDPSDEKTDTLAELADVEIKADAQPEINEALAQVDTPDVASETQVTVSTEAPVAPQPPALLQGETNAESLPEVALNVPQPAEVEPEPVEADPTAEVAEPQPAPEADTTDVSVAEENPFEDSPIAVEGDEDTAPRNLPGIAAVPQIGGEAEPAENQTVGQRVVPLTERDDALVIGAAVVPGKPIEAFAAKFENPEAKPLMSIILIDDEGAFGAEALQDFPYPLSFAVSPSDPAASEKMARHRDAGFEVLALADLPEAASAQDAEVSLAVWLETLPETVGILEGVDSGIQGNRKLADQVAAIAGGTGRGLITQDNGLNTTQKLAARNGVPSSVIFRDIDGARQDPKIMRRFLDQAAFRAGQEGTVVMLGRLRPDTISALLLWGLEDRGGRVAMAPISAVMMQEVQ